MRESPFPVWRMPWSLQGEVHPNVPAVKQVDQHTHSFSWTTVQKASTTQDGLEELRCSCGMVKERSTIPVEFIPFRII